MLLLIERWRFSTLGATTQGASPAPPRPAERSTRITKYEVAYDASPTSPRPRLGLHSVS